MNNRFAHGQLSSMACMTLIWFGLPAWAEPALNPANGHYYETIRDIGGGGWTWQEAADNAQTRVFGGYFGHLVSITSQQENDFLRDNLSIPPRSWIGGFQPPDMPSSLEPDGGWQWVTGEQWIYTNWDPAEPNDGGAFGEKEHCVHWSRTIGTWNDAPCSFRFGYYVIEFGEASPEVFEINPGLNDAWYNPVTSGQGFFITVFADARRIFLAWFTYDTERPDAGVAATVGEPGHRWVTAIGEYAGDTAVLNVELTSGGVFDSPDPMPVQDLNYGTITIVFHDCNSATLTYQFTSPGLMGEIPLTRIANDNVAMCEALSAELRGQ